MELAPSFCFSHLEDDLHSAPSNAPFVESPATSDVFQQLDVYASSSGGDDGDGNGSGSSAPLVVVGAHGSGKSAALKHWTAKRRARAPHARRRLDYAECVFWHAIGSSRLSTRVTHLLRRLVNELIGHFDLQGAMDLADDRLPWILPVRSQRKRFADRSQ